MSRAVVEVENVSKRYQLGQFNARTLRDEVDRLVQRLRKHNGRDVASHSPSEGLEFWALKNVSFSVQRGVVLGIIGRNGAGKSTLLKILSRVTEPTSGEVRIHGRVASLLEVGTGFHPELTGRENIYLNGAILGMSKAEVRSKFDEIVAFAEIERFLDTPVKRYSSGMYVRLAFAVAAHLEPEVLIVDEVLAVGDTVFQEKCLGKMREVSRSGGRTVLLVSHNMGAIQSLCESAIVLEKGHKAFHGTAEEAVKLYLGKVNLQAVVNDLSHCRRMGTGEARILSIRLQDDLGVPQVNYRMGEPLNIVVVVDFATEVQNPTFGVNIVSDTGVMVADCRSSHYGLKAGRVKGTVQYRMRIDRLGLYPRTYLIEPWIADATGLSDLDWVRDAASFLVTSGPNFVSGANVTGAHGISFIHTSWALDTLDSDIDRIVTAPTNRKTVPER
jgi:lipopolysaccharide transport system ATP-binding protein